MRGARRRVPESTAPRFITLITGIRKEAVVKPHIKIEMTAGTLRSLSDEQFHALRDKVLADGLWETISEPVRVDGMGEYVGVYLPNLFIGIEKDGYTHS